jgi:large subunit ribosomal protein L21
MYAVIETGGKQYRVSEGDVVRVESLPTLVGEQVSISDVYLVADGEAVKVGRPMVEGASVTGTVIEEGRGKKLVSFKKKRRKSSKRKIGHRQNFSALRIDKISVS